MGDWGEGAVTFALEPHPQALGLEKLEEMCQELGEPMAQLCPQPQGELGDQRQHAELTLCLEP